MGYALDATVAALRGSYNLGVFFRLGVAPTPIRLSLSVQDIPMSMPIIDPLGSTYTGAGRLLSVPQLETLINGIAQTVSFSLGGLDPQAVSLMLDGNAEVLGAPVALGIAPMDARWQPAAPVVPMWSGVADFLAQGMAPLTDPRKNRTQTLTLTAISGDQARQLGSNLTLTDLAQQTLYPGDTACSRVSRYVQTFITPWPRYV